MIRSIEAHTFCKSDEDEGFTKDRSVFADRAQSGGCSGWYGDAAADAGQAGGKGGGRYPQPAAEEAASMRLRRERAYR